MSKGGSYITILTKGFDTSKTFKVETKKEGGSQITDCVVSSFNSTHIVCRTAINNFNDNNIIVKLT